MSLSQPDSRQHHQVREDTISTDPCIPPGDAVSEGSTALSECTADRTSDKPTTNEKDFNTKHHVNAPSTSQRVRKRSATYWYHPTRT